MAYTFDSIFAVDPNNPSNVAKNASITIFDPADVTQAPVAITDPTGSPLLNPITLDAAGMGPAFQHATLDRLGWTGGGFTGYFTSFEGIKAAAVAAQAAAETAGADAAAAAQADLEARLASGEFTGTPGAPGKDGANVLPTDAAIKQAIEDSGSETRAALDARIVDKGRPVFAPSTGSRPGNRWVALGTSLTRGSTDDAPIAGKTNVSIQAAWPTFTAMLSDQRITLVKNAGITANTTQMMLDRFDTDVTPYKPTIVTLDGGTNEFLTGIPFNTFRDNFIALIGKIRSIGATPVIASILPNTAQRQLAASWVKWQRAYAAQEGIVFLDFWTLLVRPDTGILNSTAATADGTHPGLGGYLAMATYAREKLLALVPPNTPAIITDNADTDSILTNPLFLGTAVDGLAPSWLAQAQPTGASFAIGTDATFCLGNFQQIQRTATTADTILQQGVGLAGNTKVSVGERIIVTGKIFTSHSSGSKSGNEIVRLDFGVGTPRDLYIGDAWLDAAGGARFWHDAIVPAGATQIKVMYIGNAGSGTAKLGQVSVLNATRLSLAVGSAY